MAPDRRRYSYDDDHVQDQSTENNEKDWGWRRATCTRRQPQRLVGDVVLFRIPDIMTPDDQVMAERRSIWGLNGSLIGEPYVTVSVNV